MGRCSARRSWSSAARFGKARDSSTGIWCRARLIPPRTALSWARDMALIAVSGHPGCRYEEVARITAPRLGFELLTQSRIRALSAEEFGAGADAPVPDKAYPSVVISILARLATEHHLVYCAV